MLRPPRLSFALLGTRGRKITKVVPDRSPCKPGVLAERLKMLGAQVEVPQPGRKGLGLTTGAGKGLAELQEGLSASSAFTSREAHWSQPHPLKDECSLVAPSRLHSLSQTFPATDLQSP